MAYVLVFVGMLVTLMLAANAALQGALGFGPALLVIHALGLAVVAGPAAAQHRRGPPLPRVPLLLFSGGLVGLVLVGLNNWTMTGLDAPTVVALGLAGQVAASTVVDHFGWFGRPRNRTRLRHLGPAALAALGVALVVRGGL